MNGQEPDEEALREFYDDVEIQETEDNPTIRQDNGESCTLEKSAGKIVSIMKEKPHVTIPELCEITGLSDRGLRNNINKLKKSGTRVRIGLDKGGYWKVIEENL